MDEVTIIGGGLAGTEAAFAIRKQGVGVRLIDMKPKKMAPAFTLPGLAELVCSNSLKSLAEGTAQGLLKEEMGLLGSLLLEEAYLARVPAGSALALNRTLFSENITERIKKIGVKVECEEVLKLPSNRPLIIATGPLTSEDFSEELRELLGENNLSFYDAISPILHTESIDMGIAFRGSRYGKGGDDYINCPMNEEEYKRFVTELVGAKKTPIREFEEIPFFQGCMPIEEMASKGEMTLAFGPLKPVGFTDPRTGVRPFAVVQLRSEDLEGRAFNLVGFQTRLTLSEQRRVLSLIPGLGSAEFARFGTIHRNSFINSPELLKPTLELKSGFGIFFAGQITGVEGYNESAVTGILAGINAVRYLKGEALIYPPPETMTGALIEHITTQPKTGTTFQPMNANFAILKGERKKISRKNGGKRASKIALATQARGVMEDWVNKNLATLRAI
ncbi:MAG: methylenetetrahydrofolate--tRNA-(uracil(54)-C(5))-methyltransferase (FADH(2)-oxidizing) TrmFO [Deltaproteobacteria bacterium]|nr:methylenetetrahydrofolate--tRNA-(uracil(54)-C(5))-methyltransferase (FADH(2)-oxidizing) TrmFO [Deltaproteobacteria bacterium]